jgi:hypothetical protein
MRRQTITAARLAARSRARGPTGHSRTHRRRSATAALAGRRARSCLLPGCRSATVVSRDSKFVEPSLPRPGALATNRQADLTASSEQTLCARGHGPPRAASAPRAAEVTQSSLTRCRVGLPQSSARAQGSVRQRAKGGGNKCVPTFAASQAAVFAQFLRMCRIWPRTELTSPSPRDPPRSPASVTRR